MSLVLVATPIGNPDDLSLRALRELQEADLVIGEERKVAAAYLRSLDIKGKDLELLNEHSTQEEIRELAAICSQKRVALMSDCGTPGFCDPGAHLIRECRKQGISVDSIPGASSLMHILSLSSARIDEFVFRGFLPAENQARDLAWKALRSEPRAFVLMDTPYRLRKFIAELAEYLPGRKVLLGVGLTGPEQEIIETSGAEVAKQVKAGKAPFIALVYANPAVGNLGSMHASHSKANRGEKAKTMSGSNSGTIFRSGKKSHSVEHTLSGQKPRSPGRAPSNLKSRMKKKP